jgi:hypothetical protein
MLFEYAVEPRAVGSGWQNCRYLMEKFGFDRGRLISQFPKSWLRMVYDASADLQPIERARVTEILNRSKPNIVRFGRQYDANLDWLGNAIGQQARKPFRAIIAEENPQGLPFIVRAEDVNEGHPLMVAPHNWEVPRVGASLAHAMAPLLRTAQTVRFVDKYFKFDDPRYKETLRESLAIISQVGGSDIRCEIHFADHATCPPIREIEIRVGQWLRGVIPAGMSVVLFDWKERSGGEDFHDRFLLTDKGGMTIGAGFSADGPHQNAQIGLLDLNVWSVKLKALDRSATVYELADRVLVVHSDGRVEQI